MGSNIQYDVGVNVGSGGKYTYIDQYVFTKSFESINIPHTNVFADNTELFSLLSRDENDSPEAEITIDEQSAFAYAASEFKYYD